MRTDTVVVYPAADGFRWRYVAANGNIMADGGQAYADERDAWAGAKKVTGRRPRRLKFMSGPGKRPAT